MTATAAKPGSVNRGSVYRPDDDHYPTPREAVVPLIRVIALPVKVWEPACGEGHISKVLADYGHDVVSTNLRDRGFGTTGVDFLAQQTPSAKCIVTNPPFSLDEEFVEHALRLGVDVACFFLRLKWLCGADRYRRIMGPTPPALVLPYIERIRFFAGDTAETDQPGWNTEDFAWFIWRKGFRGRPTISWLSRDDGSQHDLFRHHAVACDAPGGAK